MEAKTSSARRNFLTKSGFPEFDVDVAQPYTTHEVWQALAANPGSRIVSAEFSVFHVLQV